MSAKEYSVAKGFAAVVGEDKKKVYFSPSNAHLVKDLPAGKIKELIASGHISDTGKTTEAKSVASRKKTGDDK